MEVKYNSDTYKIISQENNKSGREVDAGCKNKWNWSWLEEDVNGDFILDYIRKIDASGLAFCIYCNKPVSYGSSGKKDILAHARKSPSHLRNKKDYHQSTRLPLSWSQPQQNYINAHQSQASVICPMELPRMFIQLLSVLPCVINITLL